MSSYEAVKFPSREQGFEVAGWSIPAKPDDPSALAVIVLDGLGGAMANYAFGEEPRMAALFLHATSATCKRSSRPS